MIEKDIKKLKLNVSKGEKGFIVKLFYEFYLLAFDYDTVHYKKDVYIQLLTENFINWTFDEVKNNFKDTVKRTW